jgi:hypothetical protein
MVEIWSSLPLLKQEIKDILESLTLSGRKDVKFRYRTTDESNAANIRESTGRARLFQFGDLIINSYPYVGGGVVGVERLLPIEIIYPTTGSWPDVVESDYSLLRKYLITNTTSVSGVQGRWMKLDVPPLREDLESGWQLVTFMIYTIIDET